MLPTEGMESKVGLLSSVAAVPAGRPPAWPWMRPPSHRSALVITKAIETSCALAAGGAARSSSSDGLNEPGKKRIAQEFAH